MDQSPHGGETICWYGPDWADPDKDITPVAQNPYAGTGASSNDNAALSKYQTGFAAGRYGEVGANIRKSLLESRVPSGYIFVLTVAVKFPFSSPFVAKLFNGGSNTNKSGVYILWARGSGMIN